MELVLHLGAHRTGTTTVQDYLRRYSNSFEEQGLGYWGPRRTRKEGLGTVLASDTPCASSRNASSSMRTRLASAAARGVQTLMISDENMIGSVRSNLRAQALYPMIGPRLARFAAAFDHPISKVVISPRSLEHFWASSIAYGVGRGQPVPNSFTCRRIAQSRRGWRDVITELARALPRTEIRVVPFETVFGRPETLVRLGVGVDAPLDTDRQWLNRAPSLPELRRTLRMRNSDAQVLPFGMGRWNPFTTEDTAALRELYADDMFWLASGADGLATLTEECTQDRAGPTLPLCAATQGQKDERQKGSMA